MSFLLSVPTLRQGLKARKYSERPSSQLQRRAELVQPFLLERQRVPLELGHHPIARHEIPAQNLLCERVLDLRLNRALQRPGPIHRIEPRFADLVASVIVQPQSDVALRQSLP